MEHRFRWVTKAAAMINHCIRTIILSGVWIFIVFINNVYTYNNYNVMIQKYKSIYLRFLSELISMFPEYNFKLIIVYFFSLYNVNSKF